MKGATTLLDDPQARVVKTEQQPMTTTTATMVQLPPRSALTSRDNSEVEGEVTTSSSLSADTQKKKDTNDEDQAATMVAEVGDGPARLHESRTGPMLPSGELSTCRSTKRTDESCTKGTGDDDEATRTTPTALSSPSFSAAVLATTTITRSSNGNPTTNKQQQQLARGVEVEEPRRTKAPATGTTATTTTTATTIVSPALAAGKAQQLQQQQHTLETISGTSTAGGGPPSNNNNDNTNNKNSAPSSSHQKKRRMGVDMPTSINNNNNSGAAASSNTNSPSSTTSNSAKGGNLHPPKQQQQAQQQPQKAPAGPCAVDQEQAAFEKRLCDDDRLAEGGGIAIRKISHSGKSNLRYVRCVPLVVDDEEGESDKMGGGGFGVIDGSAGGSRGGGGGNASSTRSCSSRSAAATNSIGHHWRGGGVLLRRNSSSGSIGRKLVELRTTASTSTLPPVATSASMSSDNNNKNNNSKSKYIRSKGRYALVWGKRKDVRIALDRFVAVKKGKTTIRAKKNPLPASRILSLVTDDPFLHLDIEAPTQADRDKFARAFSKFLDVPMVEEEMNYHATTTAQQPPRVQHRTQTQQPQHYQQKQRHLDNLERSSGDKLQEEKKTSQEPSGQQQGGFYPPPLPPLARQHSETKAAVVPPPASNTTSSSQPGGTGGGAGGCEGSSATNNNHRDYGSSTGPVVSVVEGGRDMSGDDMDSESDVSSITGHGYDQEIVEELHHALNEMRAELEESRAEAARAVKVAEQAIQSAERNNSTEWQNTVTHKAAEAAALAQKRLAEAMAKQRLAEERLESEKRTASFWRKQAELAEEEAGVLQTRAAAAEVQRAALATQLECERRSAAEQLEGLRSRLSMSDGSHRSSLDSALEKNRSLELELDRTRRQLETKNLQDETSAIAEESTRGGGGRKKKLGFGRKSKGGSEDYKLLLGGKSSGSASDIVVKPSSSSDAAVPGRTERSESPSTYSLLNSAANVSHEHMIKLHAETTLVREQFEILRRTASDELQQLPEESKAWAAQVSTALQQTHREAELLRERLALEGASRRKLLHEVQDLRGRVRVYCRPRFPVSPRPGSHVNIAKPLVSPASHETLILHRNDDTASGPMSFEFDRVFPMEASQHDVYAEIQDVCLGVLDGYNICIMAYGQSGSGKTHTLLGDVIESDKKSGSGVGLEIWNFGIQLQAMEQLFTIAEQRSDRYKDVFTMTIVEVCNERLRDLLADSSSSGETKPEITHVRRRSRSTAEGDDNVSTRSRQSRLEIRSDVHGETIVQGLVSVEVDSFQDVYRVWTTCLESRRSRLLDQGIDVRQHDASSHVIATLKVVSSNIATGIGSVGRIQFVDLAGSDLAPRRKNSASSSSKPPSPRHHGANGGGSGDNNDRRFVNRSLETLNEVVSARYQFNRSIPYRNSTLTHLLRDSLEHDTKVLLVACVSSDPKDADETTAALRFASSMGRVNIGKATRHVVSPP